MPSNKKQRLEEILIEKVLATDKKSAFVVVTEGKVFVDGAKMVSPAQMVKSDAKIEIRGKMQYVGRGAFKLEGALEKFGIDVSGKICADIGSATGGFTEVLLQRYAEKVYAIDTAKGKLAPRIRDDPRVIVMEGMDVRDIKELPEKIDIAVIDISLIPLENILPSVKRIIKEEGAVVALFKPQYQTRDPKILRHGIVINDAEREKLLHNFTVWAKDTGWDIIRQMESPIKGGEGNTEFLLHMKQKL